MPNSFYNHGASPVYKSAGSSSDIRAEFDAVSAGFNKLPAINVGVANYLLAIDPSGTIVTTIANQFYLGTTLISLGRASAALALTGILSIDGNAATVTTNANLTGEVTSVGNVATLTNSAVTGKVLTGYVSGAGTVSASDSILVAIQKLNGNILSGAVNLTGPITSVGAVTSIASQTGTGTTFVVQTSPTLVTPNIGVALGTSIGVGGMTLARSPLHMVGGINVYALMQSSSGAGGTVFTNTDTIPVANNNGFSGYGGLVTLPSRWGNATTIDAHTVVYIGGGQRNNGAVSSSLVFANWGYFTGTTAAAGELGNATAQADAVKFKFECLDGGSAFAQTLRLASKSASATEQIVLAVNSAGVLSLGGSVGAESLRVSPVASAVNAIQILGGATGVPATIQAFGSDTNVSLSILPKGTGLVKVDVGAANAITSLAVNCTGASGVNLLLAGNGATTPSKTIRVLSGNLEIINSAYSAVLFQITDAGQVSLGSGPGAESLRITPIASAVNFVQISGATTGNGPIIQASGADANISLNHTSKGIGPQNFLAGANALLQLAPVASAVNYFQMINSATATNVSLLAVGTDANIGITISPKGTSSVIIDSGTSASPASFVVNNTGTNGSRIKMVGDGATTPSKTLRVGGGRFDILSDAGSTVFFVTDVGDVVAVRALRTAGSSVASLPTGLAAGSRMFVNDAASVIYGNTAVGGGPSTVGVLYTGSIWVYA